MGEAGGGRLAVLSARRVRGDSGHSLRHDARAARKHRLHLCARRRSGLSDASPELAFHFVSLFFRLET
jgi:hypothetical protein